ncbi:MAG TPA: phosphoenolpyruvate--protein phosphotransferase [Planctomycetota bacterium]|nr:phosphoenolpyruvate--protein phosphotransferase [Planctomycetota bacterium]
MEIRRGIGVSPGYAIGEAFVLSDEEFAIPRKEVAPKEVEDEVARLEAASKQAISKIADQLSRMSKRVGQSVARILQAHMGLLGDEKLRAEVAEDIRRNHHSAEYAVSRTLKRKMKVLADSGNFAWVQPILQDLSETEKALLRALLGEKREDLARLTRQVVVVANDLSPAQTLGLDRSKVLGMVTEIGGSTSHTAIVASSLGIPAAVGVEGIARDVTTGDRIILDGSTGTIILDPDVATLKRYQAMGRNFQVMEKKLSHELRELPAVTRDGTRVELFANIETPEEIPGALANGAEGVGLYRTEFLFLGGGGPPTEKTHLDAYRKAVGLLGHRRLVIRTLDLGADKMPVDGFAREANPHLGTRAIRLCFARPDIFKTQLRAILKVAALGNVQMMIPMIASVEELQRVREILAAVKRDLQRENQPVSDGIPVGIMVEVPSAAMTADLLAEHADFFSVGTNDLIAYTLAIDRTNERVASLYQPSHPAILRLLANVIEVGRRSGKPVAVCGEMSGDVNYTLLLLGLGLRTFSVVPPVIPEIKKIIRSVSVQDAKQIADHAVKLGDARKTAEFLRAETRKILPDAT